MIGCGHKDGVEDASRHGAGDCTTADNDGDSLFDCDDDGCELTRSRDTGVAMTLMSTSIPQAMPTKTGSRTRRSDLERIQRWTRRRRHPMYEARRTDPTDAGS